MEDRTLDEVAIQKLKDDAAANINDGHCLVDGIIDLELYSQANPRILWVLKESIDFGDYSQLDAWMKRKLSINEDLGPTYQMMGYVSQALLSDKEETWQSIPQTYCPDGKQGSGESLKHVAIINAKKCWGDSKSIASEVVSGYRDHSGHIIAQVELYKPDVVIFGYSDAYREIVADIYQHVEGQDLEAGRIAQDGSLSICKGNRHQHRLYLWAYHPSYRKSEQTKEEYCMEIIRAYRQFGASSDSMPTS